jgi:putative nucleotidyltransferase with HDIG domain
MATAVHRHEAQAPWAFFSLSPFSQIAIRVMKLVNQEDAPFSQISDLIASDPAFSSEVLKIANSAWYSPRVPAVSVIQAVGRLGAKNLQGICLTVAMRSFLGDALSRPVMRDMWRHNLACAFVAEHFATATYVNKELAFSGAVLHDLGRLALAVLEPKDYVFLLGKHRGAPREILAKERDAFGYDHCEVGQQLISEWKLPGIFEAIVANHHKEPNPAAEWSAPVLVNFSCRMADTIGFPSFHGGDCTAFEDLMNELPAKNGFRPEVTAEALVEEVRAKIESVEAI